VGGWGGGGGGEGFGGVKNEGCGREEGVDGERQVGEGLVLLFQEEKERLARLIAVEEAEER
jgi:hypothetical protein